VQRFHFLFFELGLKESSTFPFSGLTEKKTEQHFTLHQSYLLLQLKRWICNQKYRFTYPMWWRK